MFFILMVLILYSCGLSVFIVYKVLEIEKDINTLYDSYSQELYKTYNITVNRGVNNNA